MSTKLTKVAAAAGALAFTAFAGEAWAIEGNTPYLAGVSIGIPIGALPPPGFYASDDNVIISGGLRNNNGDPANFGGGRGINANAYLNIPSVLWVPTWQPLGFMNATIAFDVVEPYIQQSFNETAVGILPTTAAAFFNTIIGANVSWNYHPFFFKVGLGFYLPDGDWQNKVANNTWTFEPDFAVTWLNNGWNLTAHAVFDFQTVDDKGSFVGLPAKYQSGDLFFLDLTAGKSFGKWTFGGGANYSQQLNNDHISNTLACAAFGIAASSCDTPALAGIQGQGNQHMRVLIGPYMGYNFGPAEINAKILFTVHAENAFQSSFYHIGFSFPF